MKQAIEFVGEIDKGVIHLPKDYTSYTAKNVRVILLIEEKEELPKTYSQKEELLRIFQKMKNKTMFSKIDNPTEWQKNIRNEWE